MSFLVDENFGKVKAKHSSEEALQRWRDCCSVVKNSKRRFRFTANLSKRYEAADMRQTNKVLSLSLSWCRSRFVKFVLICLTETLCELF